MFYVRGRSQTRVYKLYESNSARRTTMRGELCVLCGAENGRNGGGFASVFAKLIFFILLTRATRGPTEDFRRFRSLSTDFLFFLNAFFFLPVSLCCTLYFIYALSENTERSISTALVFIESFPPLDINLL